MQLTLSEMPRDVKLLNADCHHLGVFDGPCDTPDANMESGSREDHGRFGEIKGLDEQQYELCKVSRNLAYGESTLYPVLRYELFPHGSLTVG